MTMKVHPARAIVLVAGSSAAAWWLASSAGTEAAIPALDSLVAAAVLLSGAAAATEVALLTLAALAESVLGWRPRAIGALPAPVRRFLVGSVAAALAAGVAVPASADEVYPGWAPAVAMSASPSPTLITASPSPSPSPGGTTSPDPVVELHAESAPGPLPADEDSRPSRPARGTVHVVERGESLWRIAAEVLGPEASDAAIARAWPLIYQANRDTIGNDPGLILPGQALTIPEEMAA
jgi:nucleoid-associated protein YgaU